MALGIPLPGLPGDELLKGVNSGGTLYSRIMQPILAREQAVQRQKQFDEQMKLRKAQFERSGANTDLQRAILQQQLQVLQHKNDPMWELNNLKNMASVFRKHPQDQSAPVPQDLIGQGMGAFNPEGLEALQQQAQQDQGDTNDMGIDLDMLRQNPILRGFFKKKFGIDPLAGESSILHGPARDAADLAKIKQQYGENSEIYQNAKAQYDASLDAKKDLRDLRARTKAGLKPGETEFFDEETGEPLGKNIPLTAKQRSEEEGNIIFNDLYPLVYKGAAWASGEGSIGRITQAAANYKTNAQARKMFDDLLLADKALAATVVNEASTLNAGRTNQTYKMLKESLDSQDVPKLLKKLVKAYQIPASANFKASMRYQEALSKARSKAKKGTPATGKHFYSPERQAQYEAHKAAEGIKKANANQKHEYHDDDLVRVEGPNGIEVMTYAQAKQLGAK